MSSLLLLVFGALALLSGQNITALLLSLIRHTGA